MEFIWRYCAIENEIRNCKLWNALEPHIKLDDTVYDMMCGFSPLAGLFIKSCHKVTGLDACEEPIIHLRNKYPTGEWIYADAEIYYQSNKIKHYDILLMMGVIAPLSSPQFQEVFRDTLKQINPRLVLLEGGVGEDWKPWTRAFPLTLASLMDAGYTVIHNGTFDAKYNNEATIRKYVVLIKSDT